VCPKRGLSVRTRKAEALDLSGAVAVFTSSLEQNNAPDGSSPLATTALGNDHLVSPVPHLMQVIVPPRIFTCNDVIHEDLSLLARNRFSSWALSFARENTM